MIIPLAKAGYSVRHGVLTQLMWSLAGDHNESFGFNLATWPPSWMCRCFLFWMKHWRKYGLKDVKRWVQIKWWMSRVRPRVCLALLEGPNLREKWRIVLRLIYLKRTPSVGGPLHCEGPKRECIHGKPSNHNPKKSLWKIKKLKSTRQINQKKRVSPGYSRCPTRGFPFAFSTCTALHPKRPFWGSSQGILRWLKWMRKWKRRRKNEKTLTQSLSG